MTSLQIVCQNCGAKYKLPESFSGAKAKCKACNAVIDVAVQRAAPTAGRPATTRPAVARPERARPATAKPASAKPASAKPARAVAARGEGRSTRAERGATSRGARGRRGRDEELEPKKKGGSAAWIAGGLVLVAGAVVAAVVLMQGDEAEVTGGQEVATATAPAGEAAAAQPAEAQPAEAQAAEAQAAEPQAKETGVAAAGEAAAEAAQPAAADAKPDAAQPAEADAKPDAAKPVEADTPKPAGSKITSRDQVFDPKTLEPVAYPDEVPQERRDEIAELITDSKDGGLAESRAMAKLEEIGWAAMFGVVNALREVDYFDSSAAMGALRFNRLLTDITGGLNVEFKEPRIGEEQSLDEVDWNAKTVRAWQKLMQRFPTAEAFEKFKSTRKSKSN